MIMAYRDYIRRLRNFWVGLHVRYEGAEYTVLDVDYNGYLLIDKPAKFTDTTAVDYLQVEIIEKGE